MFYKKNIFKYLLFYIYLNTVYINKILLNEFIYRNVGEDIMKGRTICPKCNHEFILDIPKETEKYKTICPNCNYKFTIRKSIECKDLDDECLWEEHGEPRKTILSSIKPRTDKPMIASLLFTLIFVIGLFSSISLLINQYQNIFLNSTIKIILNIIIDNNYISILSVILFILSIFALFGSYYSYKRIRINISILCAFLSIFSIGFFFIGSLLSIITLIILFYSREEFINEKKGKNF